MSAQLTITCDTCHEASWTARDLSGTRAVPSTTAAHELLTRPSGWAARLFTLPEGGKRYEDTAGGWLVERVRRPSGRAWRYTCPWCAGTASSER